MRIIEIWLLALLLIFTGCTITDQQNPNNSADGCIPAEEIKQLFNQSQLVVDKKTITAFFQYYIENHDYKGPYHNFELRLLPDFSQTMPPNWDDVTKFIYSVSEQGAITEDKERVYHMSGQSFETLATILLNDYAYEHKSSGYLVWENGQYTPVGWGVNDSIYYRLYDLKRESNYYTATLLGFHFWELDDRNNISEFNSPNMNAFIAYVNDKSLQTNFEEQILDLFLEDNYTEILRANEEVMIKFKPSPDERFAFVYLACERKTL